MVRTRVVLHVDFDYFFAQVEERENPSIKGKPVVVCVYSGRGGGSGVVSTANYVAREYGVKSSMPIMFAKKRLEDVDAVFIPVNHALYDSVSEKLMSTFRCYADKFEQVGVDEAFLDVTARVGRSFEKAKELATEIKQEIFAREKITCSIGIAPNKLVAKIAAGKQKPDGLTIVKPDLVQEFLSPLPVRELVGVGRKTEKALEDLGITTIGELALYNKGKLVDSFGKTLGAYLHSAALGIDENPVEEREQAESVSRITTLKENTRDFAEMIKEIDKLAKDVYSNVTKQGLGFKTVSIVAVMDDLTMVGRSKTFQNPRKNLEAITRTARELLEQLVRKETKRLMRRVGVKISNFVDEKGQKQMTDYG